MKTLQKLKNDKRGEMTYIDTLVGILVILLLVVLVLNMYSFLTLRENLNYVRDKLLETAARDGDVSAAEAALSRICDEAGVNADDLEISFEGTEYGDDPDSNVQYGDLICVSITCASKLAAGGVAEIPVTVTVKGSCLSENLDK